jgi:hypothetical protein
VCLCVCVCVYVRWVSKREREGEATSGEALQRREQTYPVRLLEGERIQSDDARLADNEDALVPVGGRVWRCAGWGVSERDAICGVLRRRARGIGRRRASDPSHCRPSVPTAALGGSPAAHPAQAGSAACADGRRGDNKRGETLQMGSRRAEREGGEGGKGREGGIGIRTCPSRSAL